MPNTYRGIDGGYKMTNSTKCDSWDELREYVLKYDVKEWKIVFKDGKTYSGISAK